MRHLFIANSNWASTFAPAGATGQNAGGPVGEQKAQPQADGEKPGPPEGPGGPASQRLRAGEAQPVAEGSGWLTVGRGLQWL